MQQEFALNLHVYCHVCMQKYVEKLYETTMPEGTNACINSINNKVSYVIVM